MMKRVVYALGLIFCANLVVAEPPPLRNNPFSRPPAPIVREEARIDGDATNSPLIVIATMVSSTSALANIEGQVMRPGQEVRGYVLKRVYEDRAVFERDGNELTVHVKPELDEENVRSTPNPRRR